MSEPTPPYHPFGVPPAPEVCPACGEKPEWRFMGQYMVGFDPKVNTIETGYECMSCTARHFIHKPLNSTKHTCPAAVK